MNLSAINATCKSALARDCAMSANIFVADLSTSRASALLQDLGAVHQLPLAGCGRLSVPLS